MDTLDTAAVYNNFGVVAFYMESFLPAKNYMNLSYEITRNILGLNILEHYILNQIWLN